MNPRVIRWRKHGSNILKSFHIHTWLCTSYGWHFPFGDDNIRPIFQGFVFHRGRVGKRPFSPWSWISLPCCSDGQRGLWTGMDILHHSLRWPRLWVNRVSRWRCLQYWKDLKWIIWQSQALLSRSNRSLHASCSGHCSMRTCRSECYWSSQFWIGISFSAPSSKATPCRSLWLHLRNTLAE